MSSSIFAVSCSSMSSFSACFGAASRNISLSPLKLRLSGGVVTLGTFGCGVPLLGATPLSNSPWMTLLSTLGLLLVGSPSSFIILLLSSAGAAVMLKGSGDELRFDVALISKSFSFPNADVNLSRIMSSKFSALVGGFFRSSGP